MATTMTEQQMAMVTHDFNWAQKYMLRRFHPRSIFIDSAGFIWFAYFFWNHDWQLGLAAAIVGRAVAVLSVMNLNTDFFAETTLGKVALLHLNPFNLITQLSGLIVLLYGIWYHSTELILGGASIILIGHSFGWSKVDSRLEP